jgi:hypothetical protein
LPELPKDEEGDNTETPTPAP